MTTQLHHYYIFNKPVGCVTANSDKLHKTVMDYFEILKSQSNIEISTLHAVGRLDKDTSGLLLITDDGAFNQRLMHPDNHISKTYEFFALGRLDTSRLQEIEAGITLTGSTIPTKPCKIDILSMTTLGELISTYPNNISNLQNIKKNRLDTPVTHGRIVLTEGRNHQVKRLIKYAGGYVIMLNRTMIGSLSIPDDLSPGCFRKLSDLELEFLL